MAQSVTADEQRSIDELHASLSIPSFDAGAVDLCSIWGTVEPYWGTIVSVATKIPIVGKTVAALLSAFGKALDACCPNMQGVDASAASDPDHQQIEAAFGAVFGQAAGEKPCCNIWKKIKPYWGAIVAVVKRIPGVGTKLADILTKLGAALDQFCG
jgi:hypothetical protein